MWAPLEELMGTPAIITVYSTIEVSWSPDTRLGSNFSVLQKCSTHKKLLQIKVDNQTFEGVQNVQQFTVHIE